MPKCNYYTPMLKIITFSEDIVTASIPDEVDGVRGFYASWITD